MADVVNTVLEYKRRLKSTKDYKVIVRTLQKLNRIDMNLDILRATKIGRTLNSLGKHEECGEFAKEIVGKWKKIFEQTVESPTTSPTKLNGSSINYDNDQQQQHCNDEYDPSGNWKANRKEKKRKAEIKYEEENLSDSGYDPSKNWKVEKNDESPSVEEYVSQKKSNDKIYKQKKRKEDKIQTKKKNKDKIFLLEEEKRKAELKAIMEKAQQELLKMENSKRLESVCSTGESEPENDKMTDLNPEQAEEKETPGAYFFTPTRRTSTNCDLISDEIPYSPTTPGIVPDCNLVSSTTLYSRSKSQESEEGLWNESRKLSENHETELSPLYENETIDEYEVTLPETAPHYQPAKEKPKTKKIKPAEKKATHDGQMKLKHEEKMKNLKMKNKSTVKRKSNNEDIQPKKKKIKKEIKIEPKKSKTQKNNAPAPSFEDFMKMDVVKKVKKKKKSSSKSVTSSLKSVTSSLKSAKQLPEVKKLVPVQLNLPEIQTTYRPLPHMTGPKVEPAVESQPNMTDDMAAELHSQRKYARRGLFSGANKFIPKMIPLFDMCIQILLQHIDALDVIGVPYEIIEPVLKKCNPDQLYHLEDVNPYFLENSDELWKVHVKRDFPRQEPDEMESWRELYWRLCDERNMKLASLTKKISAKEARRRPLEKKLKLAYVGTNAKAPRGIRRAQEKYGTNFLSNQDDKSNPRKELVKARSAVLSNPAIMHSHASQRSTIQKKVRSGPLMSKALKEMKKMRFKR